MVYEADTGSSYAYRVANMIRRTLSYMDGRLMRHGERVAYIAGEMLRCAPTADIDGTRLTMLSLLHDIGAYKTEEIDQLMRFETGNVYPHAIFGYLFLKSSTNMGDCTEAVLHHHTPWSVLAKLDTRWKDWAALIHLADRVDVLAKRPDEDFAELRESAGRLFKPEWVELFFAANERLRVVDRLRDGSYAEALDKTLRGLQIDDEAAVQDLRMIVYAIDFRSPFTVTHTAKTVAISRALGRWLRLSPHEMEALESGAFLHDIGKIGIPVEVLEKPGRLNDEEMALMRTHAALTEEIIRGLVSDEVCDIAARHHEKCDGSRYPRGLSGGALTLPQRILAVADIVSALVSKRSYKDVFPKEKVLAIIDGMRRDGQLCGAACQTLTEHYDDIMAIANDQSDPVLREYERMRQRYPVLLAEMNTYAADGR